MVNDPIRVRVPGASTDIGDHVCEHRWRPELAVILFIIEVRYSLRIIRIDPPNLSIPLVDYPLSI
jgi:hypothetical protein